MPVVGPNQHRFDPNQVIISSIDMGFRTGPAPLFCFSTEVGGHWVSLHITDSCHHVLLIHDEGMKSFLPKIPAPTFTKFDRSGVPSICAFPRAARASLLSQEQSTAPVH